jgi:hypothetical protein
MEKDWTKGGREMQLLLDIDASLPNGGLIGLKILVDTGAQVNLIKEKLVPFQFFKRAETPLKLITANNSILEGGSLVVDLGLNFVVEEDGFLQPNPVFFSGEFYGANIEVDAILSYPWMRENGVGVFPHRDALAKDHPRFGLLYAWKENHNPQKFLGQKPQNEKGVRPILGMPLGASKPLKFGHEPGRWVACDYAVIPEVLQEVLETLEVTPVRDAFANKKTKGLKGGTGRAVRRGKTLLRKTGEGSSYG